MALSNDNTMVNIGKFSGAVGLKGEVRVTLYARDSENLHVGSVLRYEPRKNGTNGSAGGNVPAVREVTSLRYQKGKPVIRMEGVTDRNAAEELNGLEIYISEDDLAELPEGEYYFRELIGLRVFDLSSGAFVGTVTDIMENPAHNIYIVERDRSGSDGAEDAGSAGEVMIPAVDAFVKEIDTDKGVITVELIEGML